MGTAGMSLMVRSSSLLFCRWWMRNYCSWRCTCPLTSCVHTLRSCTSNCPFSSMIWPPNRTSSRGSCTPSRRSSWKRQSSSPHPSGKISCSIFSSRTKSSSSHPPWGAGWYVRGHALLRWYGMLFTCGCVSWCAVGLQAYYIISRAPYDVKGNNRKFGISKLLDGGVYKAAYPLHDVSTSVCLKTSLQTYVNIYNVLHFIIP